MEANRHPPTASKMPEKIQLGRMQQQQEVRTIEDDWTGLTDAAERRKLQNRLNQRIYRKRRRVKSKDSAPILETSSDASSEDSQVALLLKLTSIHNLTPIQLSNLMNQFEYLFQQAYLLGSPCTDQLLTLIQFNVFRALLSNTNTMGFSISWLEDEDALSPFLSTSIPKKTYNPSTPVSLLPSTLQWTIPHHPWIDLWPFPAMRDNLLLAAAGDGYDEDALCNDLVDFYEVPNENTGLIVWRDPWDPSGWEVSETFVRKWAWVLRGCGELLLSTNYWRGKRGEEGLVWDV